MTVLDAPAPAQRKRGRETVRDMLLSLGLVMAFVVVVFFVLAQSPRSSRPAIRTVPTAIDLRALRTAAPTVPEPQGLSSAWRPTSSTLSAAGLRIGYVTPGTQYAEYTVHVGPVGTFLTDQTGQGHRVTQLRIGSRQWQVWSDDGGRHTSLVLQGSPWTVVVGGLRESAAPDELQQLAASLAP